MEKLRKPLESILFVSWCTPDDPCNIQISQQCASCRGMWEQQSKPSDLGWTGLHPDLGAARLGLDLPGPARILVLDCLFHASFPQRRRPMDKTIDAQNRTFHSRKSCPRHEDRWLDDRQRSCWKNSTSSQGLRRPEKIKKNAGNFDTLFKFGAQHLNRNFQATFLQRAHGLHRTSPDLS